MNLSIIFFTFCIPLSKYIAPTTLSNKSAVFFLLNFDKDLPFKQNFSKFKSMEILFNRVDELEKSLQEKQRKEWY